MDEKSRPLIVMSRRPATMACAAARWDLRVLLLDSASVNRHC